MDYVRYCNYILIVIMDDLMGFVEEWLGKDVRGILWFCCFLLNYFLLIDLGKEGGDIFFSIIFIGYFFRF